MKIKIDEATPLQLDWMVCISEGNTPVINPHRFGSISYGYFTSELGYAIPNYTTDWAQGGPVIEREKIDIVWEGNICQAESENLSADDEDYRYGLGYGPTPLIASMRCYVTSKLGDEVEVPEELK